MWRRGGGLRQGPQQFGRPIGVPGRRRRCADMLGALRWLRRARRLRRRDETSLSPSPSPAPGRDAYVTSPRGVSRSPRARLDLEHDVHLFLRPAMATVNSSSARGGGARSWSSRTRAVPAVHDHRPAPKAKDHQAPILPRRPRPSPVTSGMRSSPTPATWSIRRSRRPRANAVRQLVTDETAVRPASTPTCKSCLPPHARGHGARPAGALHPPTLRPILYCQCSAATAATTSRRSPRPRRSSAADRSPAEGVDDDGPHRRLGHVLARPTPVPAHLGVTCFRADITDGLDIRPLRELTGAEMFNEVFLDAVFVPDDLVVGEIDTGWASGPHHAGQRASRWAASSSSAGRRGSARATLPTVPHRSSSTASAGCWPSHALAAPRLALDAPRPSRGPSRPRPASRAPQRASADGACQELGSASSARRGRRRRRRAAWIRRLLGNRCLSIAGGTSEIAAQRHRRTPARPTPDREQDDRFGSGAARPTIAFDLDGDARTRRRRSSGRTRRADRLLESSTGSTPVRTVRTSTGPATCCSSPAPTSARSSAPRNGAVEAAERFERVQPVAFAEADAVLAQLAHRFRLALVTNSPGPTRRWRTSG